MAVPLFFLANVNEAGDDATQFGPGIYMLRNGVLVGMSRQ